MKDVAHCRPASAEFTVYLKTDAGFPVGQMKTFAQSWQPIALDTNHPPPEPIGNSIHIWQAQFSVWQMHGAALAANLSPAERHRMQQFQDPKLATRYAIGRGLLRELLAKYLSVSAPDIEITTNAYGKPNLPSAIGAGLRFNLAHTESVVLYAFSDRQSIGVDVELVDPTSISALEARRILSDSEWGLWQHLSNEERITMFYQTWVRKESALKALGVGLHIEPDTFSVGFASRPIITHLRGMPLCIHDLSMKPPLVAAIASIGKEMPDIRVPILLASPAGRAD